jgi:hypothetical protein
MDVNDSYSNSTISDLYFHLIQHLWLRVALIGFTRMAGSPMDVMIVEEKSQVRRAGSRYAIAESWTPWLSMTVEVQFRGSW